MDIDGGMSQIITQAVEHEKFRLANLNWGWTDDAIGVILLRAIFTNLVPYTTDQAVIQRYLTTSNERQAASAIWTNGLLSVPASALLFLVGTSLFVFYCIFPIDSRRSRRPTKYFRGLSPRKCPLGSPGW